MRTLSVALDARSYPIHIGTGLLADPGLILPHLKTKRVAVITNTVVGPLYLAPFVAGLRDVWVQPYGATPRPVWNPDVPQPIPFFDGWLKLPDQREYDNAFKVQWELFLRHVARDEPFPWSLLEGAKGVQLAEAGIESWQKRAWVKLEELK